MSIELAVRDWAGTMAGSARRRRSRLYRLECTRKLFVAAGMSDAEAKSRSLLLYACVFGLSLMHYAHFDDNLADLKQRIAERIVSTQLKQAALVAARRPPLPNDEIDGQIDGRPQPSGGPDTATRILLDEAGFSRVIGNG